MRPHTFVTLGVFAWLLGIGSASAATFTVDTTADGFFGSCVAPGDCTLRSAITLANQSIGPDTIVVPAGVYVLDPPFGAVEAIPAEAPYTGDLDVTDDVTITGAGALATVIDGAGIDRVLQIHNPANVVLSGVTIRNGNAGGDRGSPQSFFGGGILNEGSLTFTDGMVIDSIAPAGGGGIANQGSLTIARSTIRNNVMVGFPPLFFLGGGGLESRGAPLTVTDSLIADNSTNGACGGIDALGGGGPPTVVSLTNVTISGNRAEMLAGAGCLGNTPTTLDNVTIIANSSAGNVGGVSLNGAGEITIANTIIAGNTASIIPDCGGTATSGGYNLIGDVTACTLIGDLTGNVTGVSPALSSLQANGGPTLTYAPLSASPVRDAGNPAVPGSGGNACAAADQRGVARPIGSACDVGAVESNCGDGVAQGFELCEDGNTTDGDGCDSNCTPTACGNGIVTGAEQCDDGAGNGSDGCCTASCMLVDGDGDGTCDRDDPCTGGAVTKPRLTIGLGSAAPGDEALVFSGAVMMPLDPELDPRRRGARLYLAGANGPIIDTIIPSGSGQFSATGWKVNGFVFVPGPPPNFFAHRWMYTDHARPPLLPSGVRQVKLHRTPKLSNNFTFSVRGKGGTIAVTQADLPLRAALVFDLPTAESGQCAEVAFAAGGCTLSSNGRRVTCH